MLEAGKAGVLQIFSRIPSGFARLFHHETASWGYRFAPHPQTMNRELLCPRGRMLGGCSSINGEFGPETSEVEKEAEVRAGRSDSRSGCEDSQTKRSVLKCS